MHVRSDPDKIALNQWEQCSLNTLKVFWKFFNQVVVFLHVFYYSTNHLLSQLLFGNKNDKIHLQNYSNTIHVFFFYLPGIFGGSNVGGFSGIIAIHYVNE